MIEPGLTLGNYRIINKLGAGGMADVYLAEDIKLGRQVALKILPPEFVRDHERVKRFEKEVRSSAALHHPNIVTLFEVGQDQGYHYYSMALLPGGDLKGRISMGMPPQAALEIVKKIADGLGFAHQKGFIHRDVKPENVLFDERDEPQLTDLGIALAVASGTRMTATGTSIGTPHYMSPEQARGKEVDGRSDLYSLGVMLYEMLSGHVPFDADDSVAIGIMHVGDPVPELAAELQQYQPLIDRLMAKEPEKRYQNSGELIAALAQLLAGGTLPRPAHATEVMPSVGTMRRIKGGNTGSGLKWAMGGAALALVMGAGIYFGLGFDKPKIMRGGGSVVTSTVSQSQAQPLSTSVVDLASTLAGKASSVDNKKIMQNSQSQELNNKIASLLAAAREDVKALRLVKPAGNNALEKYQQIQDLDPGNTAALQGIEQIVEKYLQLASDAKKANKFIKAEKYLNRAGAVGPDSPRVRLARVDLQEARDAARAAAEELWKLRKLAGEFVAVPGGCYQMGDSFGDGDSNEQPVHEVCVDGFKIGKYEITQGQWRSVMGNNPSDFKKGDSYPVEKISWDDVQDYIAQLNRRTGRGFRLPTEAEWEYAARSGGKDEKYSGGGNVESVAWLTNNSGGHTHAVGSRAANGLGIYDMSGNVWEWCSDRYDDSYYQKSLRNNPKDPSAGTRRVYRGGSWYGSPWNVRAANRRGGSPGDRRSSLGFRLVLPPGQ